MERSSPSAAHTAPDEGLAAQAAAYALGALPEDEARSYADHLGGCAVCRRLVAEQRSVVELLPLAVDEGVVPEERLARVRERLLQAARAEPPSARAPADREATAVVPLRRRGYRQPTWLGLAASLLVAVGLLGWNLSLQRRLGEEQARVRQQEQVLAAVAGGQMAPLTGQGPAAGASGALVQAPGRAPVLLIHGLPPAPAGRVYKIWWIRGGQQVPAGTFRDGAETLVVPVEGDPAGAQQVAVTLEPADDLGPQPRGPVVMAGRL